MSQNANYEKKEKNLYNKRITLQKQWNNNNEYGNDIERILNNPDINLSSPLELFLCNLKIYNDLFPFLKDKIY